MYDNPFKAVLASIFCLLIFSSGCVDDITSTTYECPDGTEVSDLSDCPEGIDLSNITDQFDEMERPSMLSSDVQKTCPESCDDSNPCTADLCGKTTQYECEYISLDGPLEGCSGDYSCEAGSCVLQDIEDPETPSELVVETEEDPEESLEEKTAKWTILVYLDADNNLESAGIDDINEMELVGSSEEVNIIVQMDRHPSNDYYYGYDGSNGDWSTTKRFYVMKDTNTNQIKSKELKDLGEVNMGDGNSLENFLVWGIEKYPADHYAVVLWNHGDGFYVAFDDSSNHDALSMAEIEDALEAAKEAAGKKIDIVGFDACLMAMLEVDYSLKDYASIRVGSEDVEPGDGWEYTLALRPLVNNPSMTPNEFASTIVDTYHESYQETYSKDMVTQSAVDLTKLEEAIDELTEFSKELQLELQSGGSNTILSARNSVEQYETWTSVDIIDFASIIKETTTNPNLQQSSEELITALDESIINNKAGSARKHSHGIAVYFPYDTYQYDSDYPDLYLGSNKNWDGFLEKYFTGTGGFATQIDVKDFELSSNSVSPSKSIIVAATISGESITEVNLNVMEEITYESKTYQVVVDDVDYNSPSYAMEDGSHVSTWVDGNNYFKREWNAYGSAITDGNTYAFTALSQYGRETDHNQIEGFYEKGSESFSATLNFNMESGELVSVYNTETYSEVTPNEGDKFIVYRYAIDESGNAVNIPSDTLTYGAAGFAVGTYALPEGEYYLALYAYDASGNKDHEGEDIEIKEADPNAEFCSDGTPFGECSISSLLAGYKCTDGELVYDELCLEEWTCSDGTQYGECSELSIGYLCQDGFLEYHELCVPEDDYCDDGTPYGECSYWYDGWRCVDGYYEYDDSCYSGSGYDCLDGTLHGDCSATHDGYGCYYGELYEDYDCVGSCDDGTGNGFCSDSNPGYSCEDGNLVYDSTCEYYDYEYYCWDGTEAGYCSNDYPGYYCAYDGELYYYEACESYGYGGSCSDGTEHGECSESYEGYLCWDSELYEAEECGYSYDYSCDDGTEDGYCSETSPGYYCDQGELIYDLWCEGSCSDGTLDGYCSDSYSGYLCSNGELTYNSYCDPQYDEDVCWDGTEDGYCSQVYLGYACYDGDLYYDSYCDEYYSGSCEDGTMNGYCSSVNPGYGCVGGVLSYYEECDDYSSSSCSDGTEVGYCSDAYSGYWCNYYAQLEYNELCDEGIEYCSDGTTVGYCSETSPGYWCNYDAELEYDEYCDEDLDIYSSCYDWYYEEWIESGECSSDNIYYCYEGEWYDGYDLCYDSTEYCSDGTYVGYCSELYPGYWCNYYGELEYTEDCEYNYCSDGTSVGYCSDVYPGYWCNYDIELEYHESCDIVSTGYCSDGTSVGYCSDVYSGYWCNYDIELEYDYSCDEDFDIYTSCYDWDYEVWVESGECSPDYVYYCYEGYWYDGYELCYES